MEPAEVDTAWHHAAARARALLEANAELDCRVVSVKVTRAGAIVIFTTRDGRRAIREVARPADLAATLEALSVTLSAAPSGSTPANATNATSATNAANSTGTPPAAGTAKPAVGATPAVTPQEASADPAKRAPVTEGAPLGLREYPEDDYPTAAMPARQRSNGRTPSFGADGGVRIGWPGTRPTPVVGVSSSFGVGEWELGASSQWEARYADTPSIAPGIRTSSTAFMLSGGRRVPVSSLLTFIPAAALGGAAVLETAPALGNSNRSTVEGRAGLQVHALFTVMRGLLVRASAAADCAPTRWLERGPGYGFGRTPSYGAAFTLGVEVMP